MSAEEEILLKRDLIWRLGTGVTCLVGRESVPVRLEGIINAASECPLFEVEGNRLVHISQIKPILFSMKDIYHQIPINGEVVVPVRKIVTSGWEIYEDGAVQVNTVQDSLPVDEMSDYLWQLIKMRFDVNDLISKGLAVMVTRNLNPYA